MSLCVVVCRLTRRSNVVFKALVGYLRSDPRCGKNSLTGAGARMHWGKAGAEEQIRGGQGGNNNVTCLSKHLDLSVQDQDVLGAPQEACGLLCSPWHHG